MKHTLVFFAAGIIAFAIHSCGNSNNEAVVVKLDDGYTERFTKNKETGAREGWYVKSAPNTTIVEEAQYKNDTLDGFRIFYYSNGDTQAVFTYRRGVPDGPYRGYYYRNILKEIGAYQNGQKYGLWKVYHSNNVLAEELYYVGGKKHGPFKEYHANGKLKTEGRYEFGAEHGEMKDYDDQGRHWRTMTCNRGACVTTFLQETVDVELQQQ